MQKCYINMLCFLLPFLLSSCIIFPFKTTIASPVKGVVKDKESKKVIYNAKVVFSQGEITEIVYSDENGNFNVGPLTQWHFICFIGSPGLWPCSRYDPKIITIYHDGYELFYATQYGNVDFDNEYIIKKTGVTEFNLSKVE